MMPTIKGLHHWAYRCRDAEETRHFYEDILGLPLSHVIKEDHVPSTGEYCPYVHLFFELGDGSCVAFFDLGDDTATTPDPDTPRWVNHLALEVADLDALKTSKAKLEAAGIDVLGITDHGFVRSIYFFDPNGVRLELTCKMTGEEETARQKAEAHAKLRAWTERERKPIPA
jgi:catechol 2,3-dioxygenase-like lactoylglutathione lyase family enzyme